MSRETAGRRSRRNRHRKRSNDDGFSSRQHNEAPMMGSQLRIEADCRIDVNFYTFWKTMFVVEMEIENLEKSKKIKKSNRKIPKN